MRLQKKLREIAKLEAQEVPLQTNQLAKIAQKQELQDALAALSSSATQIKVITAAGNVVASIQMERSSTALDLLKVLAAKGLATLHRDQLLHKRGALKPNDILQQSDEVADTSIEVTLVRLTAASYPRHMMRSQIATSYLATGTSEGNVSLWDLRPGSNGKISFEGYIDAAVTCLEFSPDGNTLLTASQKRTAKLWSIESYECLRTFAVPAHTVDLDEIYGVYTAEFSPDGTRVVVGEIPGVWVYPNRESRRMNPCYEGDDGMSGHGATWSPAGDIVATAGYSRNDPSVFCAQTGTALQHLHFEVFADCRGLSFSPDGRFLWTVAEDYVCIWRSSNTCESNLAHDGSVTSDTPILFQSRSYLVDLSSAGLCALAARKLPRGRTTRGLPQAVSDLENGNEISMVDLDNDQETMWTRPVDSPVVSLKFQPHGSTLMVLTVDQPPCLWNVTDGVCLRAFGEHPSRRVIWSPDGTLVAFWNAFQNDYDGVVISVWNIEDGACLHTFEEIGDVTCASFW